MNQMAKLILQSSVLAPKQQLTFDSKDKVTEPERGPGFSICSWGCITSTRSHEGNRPTKEPMPHLQTNITAPLLSQGLVHGQTCNTRPIEYHVSGTRKLEVSILSVLAEGLVLTSKQGPKN